MPSHPNLSFVSFTVIRPSFHLSFPPHTLFFRSCLSFFQSLVKLFIILLSLLSLLYINLFLGPSLLFFFFFKFLALPSSFSIFSFSPFPCFTLLNFLSPFSFSQKHEASEDIFLKWYLINFLKLQETKCSSWTIPVYAKSL